MSRTRYFTISSARSMSPFKSQNAISGSIIQNSLACREVFEFSARKVGPNVYTFDNAQANASADRKSTRLNSSHSQISYAVFCLNKKKDGWKLKTRTFSAL